MQAHRFDACLERYRIPPGTRRVHQNFAFEYSLRSGDVPRIARAFNDLPLDSAFKIVRGNGARKVAMFADPNCGYCKRFEREMLTLKNVTIYTFLMPILGPDSTVKSRDIWCAKDAAVAWRAWMVENITPAKAADTCKAEALARNVELGRKYRVNGTPALFFEDGTRKPGALPVQLVDELLTAASKKS